MGAIQYGRLSSLSSELTDISLEEAQKKLPHVKPEIVKGAWKIANPKGVKQKEVKVVEVKEKKGAE